MLETNSLTSPSLTCTISPDPQEPHVLVIKANQILAVLLHISCHHGQKSTAVIKLLAVVLSSIKKKCPINLMLWLSFLGRYWVPLSLLADVCQERRERERPQPAAHIYFYVAAYQICDQNWLVFLKKRPVSVKLEYACPVETCSELIAFITQAGSVSCILPFSSHFFSRRERPLLLWKVPMFLYSPNLCMRIFTLRVSYGKTSI